MTLNTGTARTYNSTTQEFSGLMSSATFCSFLAIFRNRNVIKNVQNLPKNVDELYAPDILKLSLNVHVKSFRRT